MTRTGTGRRRLRAVTTAGCVTALVGCGTLETPVAGGSERVTSEALAWVTDQVIEGDASSAEETYITQRRRLGPAAVGADLRYRPGPGEDGELVRVVVAPVGTVGQGEFRRLNDCQLEEREGECVEVDGVSLNWETAVEGQDPGLIRVVRETEDSAIYVLYSGPSITGDPRDLDLPISVDTLVAVATDPRIAVTTSAEAVEEGSRYEPYIYPFVPGP